jgi:hypothetical protein
MPKAQPVVRYPSLRTLKSIRGARHELARVYFETKHGLLDVALAGRLSHMLSILLGSYRDHEFGERLDRIEAELAEAGAAPPRRPAGNGRWAAHP